MSKHSHSAYHLQVGSNQEGTSPHGKQRMFPNGHIASVSDDQFFEAMVVFTREELAPFSVKSNPNAQAELADAISFRATGSYQVANREIHRVGSLPDGSIVFHLKHYDIIVPVAEVSEELTDIADERFDYGLGPDYGDDAPISKQELVDASRRKAIVWFAGPAEEAYGDTSEARRDAIEALAPKLYQAMRCKLRAGHDPRIMDVHQLMDLRLLAKYPSKFKP